MADDALGDKQRVWQHQEGRRRRRIVNCASRIRSRTDDRPSTRVLAVSNMPLRAHHVGDARNATWLIDMMSLDDYGPGLWESLFWAEADDGCSYSHLLSSVKIARTSATM